MEPALQTAKGFARPLAAGDGGQDLGHGSISRNEAFAPRTQQKHLQPGFLFGGKGALFEFGEQLSQLFGGSERRRRDHGDRLLGRRQKMSSNSQPTQKTPSPQRVAR